MGLNQGYDVIVVGGGHAGTEAATVAARLGARTLLITHDLEKIGEMSCNPAIGGIGKAHLVREVDALDGIMARAADDAGIHFKLLNASKGPAVQGPRAQADRALYRHSVQAQLRATPNLSLLADAVIDIACDSQSRATGIVCERAGLIQAGAVVLTTGTFLRGVIHIGTQQTEAGRVGEPPSVALARRLASLQLPLGRLKTGTPPRLLKSSIEWETLPEDPGDAVPTKMSFMPGGLTAPRLSCRITGTTETTHALIRDNLHHTAVYGGSIAGRGPRYCPSIEDKVVRFPDRSRHQIFLEPEGVDSPLIYPNGISTSLPADLQQTVIRTIPGLERAVIARPGYAIEYDFVDPRSLTSGLELRQIPGLFLAGQINGTTGYEEAAGQGILAGINAARRAGGSEPIFLSRSDSYIGVMVDDLTTQGVTEPYRMFTSRSEFRLNLRCDNADLRLTPLGIQLGCVSAARGDAFLKYRRELDELRVRSGAENAPAFTLKAVGIPSLDGRSRSAADVLRIAGLEAAIRLFPWLAAASARAAEQIAIEAAYAGYIARQEAERDRNRHSEAIRLPPSLHYGEIAGLSAEAVERLSTSRPDTFGALQRVPGLTPAAIAIVMGHVRRRSGRVSRETRI